MPPKDHSRFTLEQVEAFKHLLREARRVRAMTQTEAAEGSGVSQSTISTMEKGPYAGMSIVDLFKVLEFYDIEASTVSHILGFGKPLTDSEKEYAELQDIREAYSLIPLFLRPHILSWIRGALKSVVADHAQRVKSQR